MGERNDGDPAELFRQALEHHAAGRAHEASRLYQDVLALVPGHPPTLHLLGVLALQLGQADAAIGLIESAVEADPSTTRYRNDLGEALRAAGRFAEAERQYEAVREIDPHHAGAHTNLGILRQQAGRIDDAIALYHRALELEPDQPEARANLGIALVERGDSAGAAAQFRIATAARPDDPVLRVNLGIALRGQNDIEGALEEYLHAQRLDPDCAAAHWNAGIARLLLGDLAGGWDGFAWRIPAGAAPDPGLTLPEWDGQDLADRRLLVHAEQGLGDTIQFARFLPLIARAHLIETTLLCQPPLRTLLARSFPRLRVTDRIEDVEADVRIALLDLPRLFGAALDSLPSSPYLVSEEKLDTDWRTRLSVLGGRRIGVVWRGRADHANDSNRSMSARLLTPLLDLPGMSFVGLQKDPLAGEIAALLGLFDIAPNLNDLDAAAAAVQALDLVITVDTAVAHLAGALGRPVWIMLPFAPDWRWLLKRGDSPWYPSARLFRQAAPGDWAGVVEEVRRALQNGG